jgi:hypothetical protein
VSRHAHALIIPRCHRSYAALTVNGKLLVGCPLTTIAMLTRCPGAQAAAFGCFSGTVNSAAVPLGSTAHGQAASSMVSRSIQTAATQ